MVRNKNTSVEDKDIGKESRLMDGRIIGKAMSFLCLFICETLAKRILSLVLIAAGVPNARITELTGLCDRSVRSLKKAIERDDNIDKLFVVGGGGRKSKLGDVEAEIVEEIENNNYYSRQQIADMIQERFGIKVSLSGVGRLLKRNRIKRLKSGSLPAKADATKQREFYDTVLHPLMEQAKSGKIALLFLDASHFIMGCNFLGYIYGVSRRFIKTYSGRMRYNVLGALDFITKNVTTVTNDTYITATEICELLRKISIEYAGKAIHLILDNARYQKCKAVFELAAELGINLVYIPPYSPNLNLIERLWKFVKGKLRSKYYDRFDVFINEINSIVHSTHKENRGAIDKLISEKIQLFDDLVAVNENSFTSNKQRKKLAA